MPHPFRVLLTTWGSFGDLYPYLGLAIRLKERGHAPVLATCPYHRSVVERAGIEFRPLRPDVDPSETGLIRRVMDPRRGSEVVIRELIVGSLRDQYDDVHAAASDADVIVSHPVTFATPIVAEQQRRPWLSVALAPLSFFSVSDFPVLAPLPLAATLPRLGAWAGRMLKALAKAQTRSWTAPVRAFRQELGLPAAADPIYEGQFSPHGTLALFSRVMGGPQPDWPAHTVVTGFVFYSGPEPQVPGPLGDFLDRGDPPIVFTLGTSAVGAAGAFYEESASAVEQLGRRGVLLLGTNPENRPRRPLPPTIVTADYAPHETLFSRAAAVVHHGGVGTTGQVLRSGRPMVVVPFAHDQPDNADRVRRLGVARVVTPKRYAAARVSRELRALLETASYGTRAEEIGRMVTSERGPEAACEMIERVAHGRAASS